MTEPAPSSSPTCAVTTRSRVTSTPVVSRSKTPTTLIHSALSKIESGSGRHWSMPITVCAPPTSAPRRSAPAALVDSTGGRSQSLCSASRRDPGRAARDRGRRIDDRLLGLRTRRRGDDAGRGARVPRRAPRAGARRRPPPGCPRHLTRPSGVRRDAAAARRTPRHRGVRRVAARLRACGRAGRRHPGPLVRVHRRRGGGRRTASRPQGDPREPDRRAGARRAARACSPASRSSTTGRAPGCREAPATRCCATAPSCG